MTVVGCLCTPLDLLGDDVELPPAEIDDLIVIFQAGRVRAHRQPDRLPRTPRTRRSPRLTPMQGARHDRHHRRRPRRPHRHARTHAAARRSCTADTALFGSLPELDSFGVVALVAALEDRFDITIDDDEFGAELFETVGTLTDFVDAKRASA